MNIVNIYPTIRKSHPNKDGSFNIKIAISACRETVFLTTRYNVDSEKQFESGRVVRREDAKEINRKIRLQIMQYEEIVDEFEPGLSAKEIRSRLEDYLTKPKSLIEFAEVYQARLERNGQTSYAQNMGYTISWLQRCFSHNLSLKDISYVAICKFESYLTEHNQSSTTVNIRMSHLKALLNAAVNEGLVEYKVFPFRNYHMPSKNVRDICIDHNELSKLRDATFDGVSAKRFNVARDLFMLSFYCGGINLTDIMDATLTSNVLTFIRKKTATKKKGSDIQVSITIQPEARAIIDKYINKATGKLDMGYNYSDYKQFCSFVTKSLGRIGEQLGFEKKLMFYSARKTFVQFGSELGIPLYILEYAIGQTIKEASNRPVFNYLKVMRSQADLAIRTIIDYSLEPECEDTVPLPEWARRRK